MYKIGLALFSCFAACAQAQIPHSPERTIEVTGSAELLVDPETVIFHIAFEEYWKEEYEGKKWEDYKNKISIESIEGQLIEELQNQGISMSDITLLSTGNYWRARGKDFLVRKVIEIELTDFAKANVLSNELQTRGIQSMYVKEMKHGKMDELQLQCKAQALVNAGLKAEGLLAAIGETRGPAMKIVEVDQNQYVMQKDMAAMRTMASSEQSAVEYEQFRKIVLNAQFRVLYAIQ